MRPWPRASWAASEERAEHIAERLEDGPAAASRTKNRLLHGAHRLVDAADDIIHDLFGPLDLRGRDRRRACGVVRDALHVGDDWTDRLFELPEPIADTTHGPGRDDH